MSTSARVELEPAFVLHARAYRETSQIVEVFTAAHGRMGLMARGARRPKSALRGLLNPFQPLRISWSGRGELPTLTHAEFGGTGMDLAGTSVMAGFYVNELLLKLLERSDPHRDLFAHYASLLAEIAVAADVEPALRCFEIQLLNEIGYALNLRFEALSDAEVRPENHYLFRVEEGPVPCAADEPQSYSGAALLAIGQMEFETPEYLQAAKRLLRSVLNHHLGDRGLQTRRVASAMKR